MKPCISRLIAWAVIAAVAGLSAPAEAAVVAYWDFQDDPLADKSGNSHDLTNSGVTFSDGAAVFNGAHTTFSTTNTLDLTPYDELTVEWFMKTSHTADVRLVWEHTDNLNGKRGAIGSAINGQQQAGTTEGNLEGGGNSIARAAFVNDGAFHHYAVVFDRTTTGGGTAAEAAELFIDGFSAAVGQQIAGTYTDPTSFRNDYFYIGSRNDASYKFVGQMDDVRISSEALLPSQFIQTRSVPEPSSLLVFGLGFLGLFGCRRRRVG